MLPCAVRALIVGLIMLPTAARAAEAPLTLEDAIALALANNERSLKAPPRVEVAAGGLDRARSAFLPTLIATGNGGWASIADRNGRNFAGDGALTVNQPLVNASSFPLYSQARHTLESERWGAVEDLRVLAFDTASAFITALSTNQLLIAAQQRLQRAQADMDDSAARAQAGLTSSNDVTRASVAVSTAQTQVATAQGNVARAYLQLAYLVGTSVQGPLVAPERTTNNARHNTWNPDEVARRAEDRRPDVKSAIEHTEALRAGAREPLYRLIPTLGLEAQLKQIIDPAPMDIATSGTAALTLTWTIFDAGIRYADRRTRLAQAVSASLDEHALRRSVATDIAIAVAELRAARTVLQVSEQAVVTAQKNTDETAILYKQGLAKAIELTDANASRYDADATLATAKLGMEQSYLNLRFALGLGPVSDELPKVGKFNKRAQ
ncbi:MAG TPA: TolC family protein [Polyangia bacterium]|nr:TolC family protein [Polyangia bacterium]